MAPPQREIIWMEKKQLEEMFAMAKEKTEVLAFLLGKAHSRMRMLLEHIPEDEWREGLGLLVNFLDKEVNRLFYEPNEQPGPLVKAQQ